MRLAIFVCSSSLAIAGCAADQRLAGVGYDPAAIGSLIPVRVISRCAQDHGAAVSYRPFTVIDGQLHLPADTAALRAVAPSTIESIRILKGDAAAAAYGPVAGIAGVVIVRTHRTPGTSRDMAPNDR